MRFASLVTLAPAVTLVLLLGQGALAQSVDGQRSAKLGAPASAGAARPQPDPGTLFSFAGAVGQTLQFATVGNTSGMVWGDGLYTSDSVLGTAAVHAGLLELGEGGVVTVEIVPGPASYAGAERHGVTSRSYQSWAVAFRFIGVAGPEGGAVLPEPGLKATGKLSNMTGQ